METLVCLVYPSENCLEIKSLIERTTSIQSNFVTTRFFYWTGGLGWQPVKMRFWRPRRRLEAC